MQTVAGGCQHPAQHLLEAPGNQPSARRNFTIATSGAAGRSPERWARAVVEDAAGLGGQFVWRVLLGLRLERQASPDHVGGWKIADRGETWIRLEATSWFLTAHIVVEVDDGEVSVATFIRYDRPFAPLLWAPVSVGHRRAMPGLLRHAVMPD